jgi:hypothetical protein
LNPYLTPCTKLNQDGRKHGGMLHDIGLSNDFQDMTSKAQTTKEKNRKVFKNFKKFVPQRTLSAKWKINSQYERR